MPRPASTARETPSRLGKPVALRGDDEDEPILGERNDVEGRIFDLPDRESDGDAPGLEVRCQPHGVGDVHVDVGMRMLGFERRKERGERVVTDRQRRTELQSSGSRGGELLHLTFERRDVLEHRFRALREETARVGEDRAPLDDIDERHGEVFLHCANLQSDCGLGEVQLLGGAGEVPELGQAPERMELREGNRHRGLLSARPGANIRRPGGNPSVTVP
jgi:hypothetical protein